MLDFHVALADLQGFLAGAVAAHFGGGAVDAQQLVGQLEAAAVAEGDFHQPGFLVQLDLGRGGGVFVEAAHVSLQA